MQTGKNTYPPLNEAFFTEGALLGRADPSITWDSADTLAADEERTPRNIALPF